MNPEYLINLYNRYPQYFTAEEVDSLEEQAKSAGIPFQRNPQDTDFSIGRTLAQATQGFVEGMTTLHVGEDPRNTTEGIARSIGHLAGFVGVIPGVGTAISASTKGAARLGKLGIRASKGISKSAHGVSVPMIATNLLFNKAGKAIKSSESLRAMKLMQDTSKMGNMAQQALHLGTASAISSWQDGIDGLMEGFVSGTIAGGIFAGIPNFKLLNSMVKSGDPRGLKAVRTLAGSMANLGMTHAYTGGEAPTEEMVYQFLLGGYFGYKTTPFTTQLAHKRLAQAQRDVIKEGSWRPPKQEDIRDYPTLPHETKSELDILLARPFASRVALAQSAVNEGVINPLEEIQQAKRKDTGANVGVLAGRGKDESGNITYLELNKDGTGYHQGKINLKKLDFAEYDPTKIAVKKAETNQVEDLTTDYVLNTLLPTKIKKASQSISKKGNYDETEVADFLNKLVDGKIKTGAIDEDFLSLIDQKYPEAKIFQNGEAKRNLQSFIKYRSNLHPQSQKIWTPEGLKDRGNINTENQLVYKERPLSYLDKMVMNVLGIPEGMQLPKVIVEKAEMPDNNGTFREMGIYDVIYTKGKLNKEGYKFLISAARKNLFTLSGTKTKEEIILTPLMVDPAEIDPGKKALLKVARKYNNNATKDFKKARNQFINQAKKHGLATSQQAGRIYDSMWVNNIAMLEHINGLTFDTILKANKNAKKGKKPFIVDPVAFNSRMQIIDAGEPGLNPRLYKHVKNAENGFKIALVDSTPLTLKNKILSKARGLLKSHLDGVFILRQDVFDSMLKDGGFPYNAGTLKGTVTSQESGKGLLVGKFAYFRASDMQNSQFLNYKIHGQMYDTAAKQHGLRTILKEKIVGKTQVFKLDGKRVNPLDHATTIQPEDMRMNLSVYENPKSALRNQILAKQMMTNINEQQIDKRTIDDFFTQIARESIIGDPVIGDKIERYLKEGKGFEKGFKDINPDDIPLPLLIRILNGKDNPLLRAINRKLMNVENDWYIDDIQTLEEINFAKEVKNWNTQADRIMKLSELTPATMDFKWILNLKDDVLRRYFIHRVLRPRQKFSGKAIGVPYDLYQQEAFKMKSGEFMLQNQWKKFKIKVGEDVLTLGDAWNEYQTTKNLMRKKDLAEAFNMVIARIPIDSISGIRSLMFKGFTKDRGAGIMLHPEDMIHFSGMDLDIDSVFIYQNMPKGLKGELHKNRNEWYNKAGQYIDAKSKTMEALFTKNSYGKIPFSDIKNSPVWSFDPRVRMDVNRNALEGSKVIGVGVNELRRSRAIYDFIKDNPGAIEIDLEKLDLSSRNNLMDVLGIKDMKKAPVIKVHFELAKDKGQGLREMGRSAVQFAADSKDYAGLIDASRIRRLIFNEVYDRVYLTKGKGKKRYTFNEHPFKWMNATVLGDIIEMDSLINGKEFRYNKNRRLSIYELGQRMEDLVDRTSNYKLAGYLNYLPKVYSQIKIDADPQRYVNFDTIHKQGEILQKAIDKLPNGLVKTILENYKANPMKPSPDPLVNRNYLSNGLAQLVSVKRMLLAVGKAKQAKISDERIMEIIRMGDRYQLYFTTLLNRAGAKREISREVAKSHDTLEKLDINLKADLEKMNPQEKNVFYERLLGNVFGPGSEAVTKKVSKYLGEKDDVVDTYLKKRGDNLKYADINSMAFNSTGIPNKTISDWFKTYNEIASSVSKGATKQLAKEILRGKDSKDKRVRTSRTADEKTAIMMKLLSFEKASTDPAIARMKEDLDAIFRNVGEEYTKDFELKFLGTASTSPYNIEVKIPKTLRTSDMKTIQDFIAFWKQVTRGKYLKNVAIGNVKPSWKDMIKFPQTISKEHLNHDLKWALSKNNPIFDKNKVKANQDLLVPISSHGKIETATEKAMEVFDGNEKKFAELLFKRTEYLSTAKEGAEAVEDAISILEMPLAERDATGWYKKEFNNAQKRIKKNKNKTYVLKVGGKATKMNYKELVNQIIKDINKTTEEIYRDVVFGEKFDKNLNFFPKDDPFWDWVILHDKKGPRTIGNINIDATISKKISSPLFLGKYRTSKEAPFRFLMKLSDVIQKAEMTTAGGKKVRELPFQEYYNAINKLDKKFKHKGIGFIEGFWPHLNHMPSVVEARIKELKKKGASDTEIEQIHNQIERSKTPDGYMAEAGHKLIMMDEYNQTVLGFKRRPPNLLSRNQENPIPSYDKTITALKNYHSKLLKGQTNLLIAISSYKTINDFNATKSFGKNTEQFTRLMRMYVAQNLGYPSSVPEHWLNDPMFPGNKKSWYYNFTDQAAFKRMEKYMPKLVGKKGKWAKNEQQLAMKIAHFSNLEAKWQLFTLLVNTRTYANNIFGGSENTGISAGFKNLWRASSGKTLDQLVPRIEGDPLNRSFADFQRIAEKHGAVETFLTGEFRSNPMFKGGKGQQLKKEIEKLRANGELNKKNVLEVLRRSGISEKTEHVAGFLMRVAEERLRTTAYWAHYLKGQEVFANNGVVFERDDPILVNFALKGSQNTQYLYNNAKRPAFARTSMGRVFARFQIWTWNSIRFRREIYRAARAYDFEPGTAEFDVFKRMMISDMFIISLGTLFPMSIFDNTMPPPYSILQDLSNVAFGDEKQRERAFFGSLPAPFNVVQAVSPPSARYIMQPLGSYLKGDWDRFLDYQIWNMFPFGLAIKTGLDIGKSPMSAVNKLTGFPLFQISNKVRKARKEKEEKNATT